MAVATNVTLPHAMHDGEGAVATMDTRPRTMHDGEGAPLLRPLARLTSFGGYVATTNYHLPTINQMQSQIEDHK